MRRVRSLGGYFAYKTSISFYHCLSIHPTKIGFILKGFLIIPWITKVAAMRHHTISDIVTLPYLAARGTV
jgi:hypothetical protein